MTAPLSILIIDDEPQIRRLLRVVLEGGEYRVFEAEMGATGIQEAASRRPDLILLDLGLPDMRGNEVLRRIREWSTVPVLILSVHDDEEDKVEALDGGADDYVTKPFNNAELLARLRVLTRRLSPPGDDSTFESGPLRVDFAIRQVFLHNREIPLTPTEYALLRVLVRNAGKVVTHRHLLTSVWGPNSVEQSQYLRVYMTHLRNKLASDGKPFSGIHTETRIGYRLILDEERG
ncbi:MAG: response regulator [Chthoniobacterales bacterium]